VSDLDASSTIGGLGEAGLLAEVFTRFADAAPFCTPVALGPGDDAAYVRTSAGVVVTTDTMVRGRDWNDAWSSPSDVGAKVVTQNLADVAAMGGVGTALLVTLVAPPSTTLSWVNDLAGGIAEVAARAGVRVAGGDLSSSDGEVSVSATALGELPAGVASPVLRSGARPTDVWAVSGGLGRSAAGLEVLRRSEAGWFPPQEHAGVSAAWVGYHCRPDPDLSQGPAAARAGASSLIDISDGLVRDAHRVASASRVHIRLQSSLVAPHLNAVARVLGLESAWECVFHGGEEHVLLGSFAPASVPPGWTVVGGGRAVDDGDPQVWLDGAVASPGGWDHFAP